MKPNQAKTWRVIAETALGLLPNESEFGKKQVQISSVATELGTSAPVLQKYLLVHQFVKKLSERHPEQANFLWTLPVGAAEAFKRWVQRDPIEAVHAMRLAEVEAKVSRQIILEEKASRAGVSSSTLHSQDLLLKSLAEANQNATDNARESPSFKPRIPVLFDIDPNLMVRPPPHSNLEWCGVHWIASGTVFFSEQNTKDNQVDFNHERSVWDSLLNSTEVLDLAIINVSESLKTETYESGAGEVIAKALLASRFVFLVLINVPNQHAWDTFIKFAPRSDVLETNGTVLRSFIHRQELASRNPISDSNLIDLAWILSDGLAGNVVICYPDIWERVMFVSYWPEGPLI